MPLPPSISELNVFTCFGSGVPWTPPGGFLHELVHFNNRKKTFWIVSGYDLMQTDQFVAA